MPPSRGYRWVLLAAIAVALAAGLRVWAGLLSADFGYEQVRAVQLGQRLQTELEALDDELAAIRRTDFLEEEAQRRLGLGPPSAGQVVDLRGAKLGDEPSGERQ